MRTRKPIALVLAFAMLVVACGSDGDTTDTTGGTTTASTEPSTGSTTPPDPGADDEVDPEVAALLAEWVSDDPANPVDLEFAVVEAESTSALITTAGGSISVIGPDGTAYTLDVPADALIADETITMTPLASVSGVPTDGVVTGVLLEPDGLVFVAPATLTITSPDGVADLRAGSTFANGSDFHLVASEMVGGSLVVEVRHFSVQANMRSGEQIADLRGRYQPTSGQARFEEAYTSALELMNGMSDADFELFEFVFINAFVRMFGEWKDDSVLPNLSAAAQDETRMDQALAEAGTFLGRIEILWSLVEVGSEEEAAIDAMIEEVELAMGTAIETAVGRAAQRCVDNLDPDEAARIWRWGQLAARFDLWWAIEGSVGARVRNCLTFELDLTAAFSVDAVTSVATARLLFDWLTGEESVTGVPRTFAVQDSISYDVFEVDGLGTGCETETTNGRFEFELAIDMNVNYLDPGIEGLTLTVRVLQNPSESVVCGETTVDFGVEGGGGFWLPHFRSATNTIGSPSEFAVILPVVRDGDVYARLTSTGNHPVIVGSTEDISYELIHRPAG